MVLLARPWDWVLHREAFPLHLPALLHLPVRYTSRMYNVSRSGRHGEPFYSMKRGIRYKLRNNGELAEADLSVYFRKMLCIPSVGRPLCRWSSCVFAWLSKIIKSRAKSICGHWLWVALSKRHVDSDGDPGQNISELWNQSSLLVLPTVVMVFLSFFYCPPQVSQVMISDVFLFGLPVWQWRSMSHRLFLPHSNCFHCIWTQSSPFTPFGQGPVSQSSVNGILVLESVIWGWWFTITGGGSGPHVTTSIGVLRCLLGLSVYAAPFDRDI